MKEIKIGQLYRHFKGNIYRVVAVGKNSETLEDMVVYQSEKDNEIWVRPLKMWNDIIDEKGSFRFTIING